MLDFKNRKTPSNAKTVTELWNCDSKLTLSKLIFFYTAATLIILLENFDEYLTLCIVARCCSYK